MNEEEIRYKLKEIETRLLSLNDLVMDLSLDGNTDDYYTRWISRGLDLLDENVGNYLAKLEDN